MKGIVLISILSLFFNFSLQRKVTCYNCTDLYTKCYTTTDESQNCDFCGLHHVYYSNHAQSSLLLASNPEESVFYENHSPVSPN